MAYPFTPTGASDLLAALYALSDADLQIEADALRSDFKSWVETKFTLDSDQTAYLNGMNDNMTHYLSEQCHLCLINRLTINLEKPPTPSGYQGKWFKTRNSIETSSESGLEATGSFTIEVVYKL